MKLLIMRPRGERYQIGTAMTSFGDVTAKNWSWKQQQQNSKNGAEKILSLVPESYIKVGKRKRAKL